MTEDRGKQQSASVDCIAGSAYDDKILLADVEQPKHLLVYDLGLGDSDQAFHSLSTHDHSFRGPSKTFAFALRQPKPAERQMAGQKSRVYASLFKQARNAIIETRAPGLVPPLPRDNFRETERPNRERSASRQHGRDRP